MLNEHPILRQDSQYNYFGQGYRGHTAEITISTGFNSAEIVTDRNRRVAT